MAVLPVTLTVGDTAYELGTVETLDADDAQREEMSRFLRAVADNLDDGYSLREVPS
ncbi:hypothetical protein ACIBQ1_09845 [Nonomuraea sp. NPDC050153]|uniref:hypothetical protein n=1 Tax=Nonomuraea sp. NPDC050153 TaxID=3364359 RepID=UPI003792F656